MAQAQTKRRYASTDDEIVDRVRRIETRFTKYLEWQGFDTQVARAEWIGDRVSIPSPAVSLQEIIKAIPDDWAGRQVMVFVGADFLVTVQKPFKAL